MSAPIDQAVAMVEVLALPAALLEFLPLEPRLTVAPAAGGAARVLDATAVGELADGLSVAVSVADVLDHHGLRLQRVDLPGSES